MPSCIRGLCYTLASWFGQASASGKAGEELAVHQRVWGQVLIVHVPGRGPSRQAASREFDWMYPPLPRSRNPQQGSIPCTRLTEILQTCGGRFKSRAVRGRRAATFYRASTSTASSAAASPCAAGLPPVHLEQGKSIAAQVYAWTAFRKQRQTLGMMHPAFSQQQRGGEAAALESPACRGQEATCWSEGGAIFSSDWGMQFRLLGQPHMPTHVLQQRSIIDGR